LSPGPGEYKILSPKNWTKQSPPTLKFRHGSFFDQDVKFKGSEVSPQKYHPSLNFVKSHRYGNIGIGIGLGEKLNMKLTNTVTPGPGAYNLPSVFDKSRKLKLGIN